MVQKQKRGVGMQGRRSSETSQETALIADAGLTLSLLGGNLALAREFGLAAAGCRVHLTELEMAGLPTPALALNFDGVMQQNWLYLDQRFPQAPEAPRSTLSCKKRP